MTVTIVSREAWGARPPDRRHAITIPTPRLWLHHSAASGTDERSVRGIQNWHMDGRGWSDIGYSFLIDNDPPDVDVFEGRGAGWAGGHTKGDNTQSHGICVIGDYSTNAPHDDTLEVIAQLAASGFLSGWWPGQITGGHRDAPDPDTGQDHTDTACPGDALYALIPSINNRIWQLLNGDDTMPDDVTAETVTADEVTADEIAETGERPGLDRPFGVTWPWARNRRVFSEHTEPDDAVSAEEFSAYLHRYHHRVFLPELRDAIAQVGSGEADNVARNLARRALDGVKSIGEAADDA